MHCFSFLALRNHLGLVAWSSFVLSEKAYHRRATESTRSETLYLGVETCSHVKVTIYSHISHHAAMIVNPRNSVGFHSPGQCCRLPCRLPF